MFAAIQEAARIMQLPKESHNQGKGVGRLSSGSLCKALEGFSSHPQKPGAKILTELSVGIGDGLP